MCGGSGLGVGGQWRIDFTGEKSVEQLKNNSPLSLGAIQELCELMTMLVPPGVGLPHPPMAPEIKPLSHRDP